MMGEGGGAFFCAATDSITKKTNAIKVKAATNLLLHFTLLNKFLSNV